jgi:CII-binding regulator of phage lambda lysogenization HflD
MIQTHANIRFEKARKRLSSALENLEDVVKNKLHEEASSSRIISAKEESETKLAQQEIIIQNLTLEINNLQQSLSDLGRETEFLNTKNQIFAEKLAKLRQERLEIIAEISEDLNKIFSAIKVGESL